MSEGILDSIKNVMPSKKAYSRLICTNPEYDIGATKQRQRAKRQNYAKSKAGTWGPTHSEDSEDNEDSSVGPRTPEAASPPVESSTPANRQKRASKSELDNVFSNIWAYVTDTLQPSCGGACDACRGAENLKNKNKSKGQTTYNTPSKCKGKQGNDSSPFSSFSLRKIVTQSTNGSSGILKENVLGSANGKRKTVSDENARAAAKAMANQVEDLWQPPPPPQHSSPPTATRPTPSTSQKERAPPISHVAFNPAKDFSKSISELTMKSCLAEVNEPISTSRRMAYYAVGKHVNQKTNSGSGNRRCYFTGALIRGGQPFYAGSVQQGLRTLVVFCIPKALGLPKKEDLERIDSVMDVKSCVSNVSQKSKKSQTSQKSKKSILSRYSSIWSDAAADSDIMTDAWDVDEFGNITEVLNSDWLLQALPEPCPHLMIEMQRRFPDEFETLPQQVRLHKCWRLYMRFCFFSGLPIADGEMYYKVSDKVTGKMSKQLRKAGIDEIILSHEVMEAAHGHSSEILSLPTKKTFRYLNEQYKQQCSKLSEKVFRRTSWEKIMPEV